MDIPAFKKLGGYRLPMSLPPYGGPVERLAYVSRAMKEGLGIKRLYDLQDRAITALEKESAVAIVAPPSAGKSWALLYKVMDDLARERDDFCSLVADRVLKRTEAVALPTIRELLDTLVRKGSAWERKFEHGVTKFPLAEDLGVKPGAVRAVLDRLETDGTVELQRTREGVEARLHYREGPSAVFIFTSPPQAKHFVREAGDRLSTFVAKGLLSVAYWPPQRPPTCPAVLAFDLPSLSRAMLSGDLTARFLKRVGLVVTENVHLAPVMETAYVVRRFVRLVRRNRGAAPKLVVTSAPTSNGDEVFRELLGRKYVTVTGMPKREVIVITLYRPTHGRATEAAAALARKAVDAGKGVVVMCNKRWELARLDVALRAAGVPVGGGAHPACATTTIDDLAPPVRVGGELTKVTAVVHYGMPTSLYRVLTYADRLAGEMEEVSVKIVLKADPQSNYVFRSWKKRLAPSDVIPVESDNETLGRRHILCACVDAPLGDYEAPMIAPRGLSHIMGLAREGLVRARHGTWYATRHGEEEARGVPVTDAERGIELKVTEGGSTKVVDTVDLAAAASLLTPGAMYFMGGRTYEVVSLSYKEGAARARHILPRRDVYTKAIVHHLLKFRPAAWKRVKGGRLAYGDLGVTLTSAYNVVREKAPHGADKIIRIAPVGEVPMLSMYTKALVFTPSGPNAARIKALRPRRRKELQDEFRVNPALHALSHAMVYGVSTNFGISTMKFGEYVDNGKVVVYETTPGGRGVLRQAFKRSGRFLDTTRAYLRCIRKRDCTQACLLCTKALESCSYSALWLDRPAARRVFG